MTQTLPPGQHRRLDFPRFGLLRFAQRMPTQAPPLRLRVCGLVRKELWLDAAAWAGLQRVTLQCDFHCVTGWSSAGLSWSGVRMRDVYQALIQAQAEPDDQVAYVLMRGSDGARACLPLADLLAEDVLLADQLNGQALGLDHGAPLRLVAPAHYGYKSVKHLERLEFCRDLSRYRSSAWRFMDHPRARVAHEERGRWLPGWLLRWLYRPLVTFTVRRFAKAGTADRLAKHG
ncbi:molybdopterin-dependent oxidoreductase [Paucibacter sp. B51]|uniref:molybdopterin-dependent oxidoreductase n=1 Tax=Paucibacter sp. B51 TaxID=2993315 RepID=UPI0022EBCC2F|nr:molybdopterin-dependent oxidoreductase [Paucibacter sp. B51]